MIPKTSKSLPRFVRFYLITSVFLFYTSHLIAAGITYTWTGASDNNWANSSNWTSTSGDYPGHIAATDIAVITNQTNEPTLSANLTDSIATLTINASSVLTITGSTTLMVTANTTVNGELNLGPLAIINGHTTGTLRSTTGGTIDVTSTGNSDDFTTQYSGFKTYSLGSLTTNFEGASAQLISVSKSFGNVNISNTHGLSASINFHAGGTITINSNAFFTPGAANTVFGAITGTGTLQVTRTVTGIDDLTSQCTSVLTLTNLTIEYVGTAVQNIAVKKSQVFDNITINNSSGVLLDSQTTINGVLTFNSGNLTLGNYKLIIGSSGSISGAGSSNYIVTNGTGALEMNASTSGVAYPVGDDYNPITITASSGTPLFDVAVTTGVTDATNTAITDHAINRTWTITNVSGGAATVTVTPQWDESSDMAGLNFDNTNVWVSSRTSLTSGWVPGTSSTADNNILGTLYNLTSGSISTSNSTTYYIGVGDNVSALPVSLTDFNAQYQDGCINLNWATVSEQNNAYFDIERSLDAATWTSIGEVQGHNTTNLINRYMYIDNLAGVIPSATIYYRLKQVDFNGAFTYSMIRSVNITVSGIAIYPNPTHNTLNVNWTNAIQDNSTLRLINMSGINVYHQSVSGKGMMQRQIDMSALPMGVYYLEIISGNGGVVNDIVTKD